MAKKTERVFALVMAMLFLVTTLGFTGLVLWQSVHKKNQPEETTIDQLNQSGQTLKGTKLDNYTPVADVTQLQTVDLVDGDGDQLQPGATVTVNYTGALASDGTIFESSLDSGRPITFQLDQVIPGWTQGLPGMKVGGTRRLIIPADLAYGDQSPSPDIPANSALVFDVELIAIK